MLSLVEIPTNRSNKYAQLTIRLSMADLHIEKGATRFGVTGLDSKPYQRYSQDEQGYQDGKRNCISLFKSTRDTKTKKQGY